MKKRVFFIILAVPVLLLSCVDGNYDPEGRWEINASEADMCEENDSFANAYDPESDLDLLYLNFYDDIIDYYIYSFNQNYTYELLADVPFDHTANTTISVYTYSTDPQLVASSVEPADDERDSIIEAFQPEASTYYIVVTNTLASGTGELRGYMLTINQND